MKKKILAVLAAFTLIFGTVGCQSAAKNFGGDYTLKLPKNEKLVMITWKNNSLWYLDSGGNKGGKCKWRE